MTSVQGADPRGPRFSLIVAVYNNSDYLPDFIRSIEHQSFDMGQVELIMVDDGSTDESVTALRKWEERRPDLVTVMTKEHGGQSSARNLGLAIASGDWITFPHADSVLDRVCLSTVSLFIDQHPGTEMVGASTLRLEDRTGAVTDDHPLRKHFGHQDRLLNLGSHPTFFFGSAHAAFFKRERLEEFELRFDERIRPTFEGGHFCINYLLESPEPRVAFLR